MKKIRYSFMGKLSFKIISIITVIIILSLFTLSLVINNNVYSEIKNLGQDRNLQAAKYVRSEVEIFLYKSKDIINVLANDSMVAYGNSAEKDAKFSYVKEEYSQFESVYYATDAGEMHIYPAEELPDDYDPREEPWYQTAVESESLVWTSVFRDESNGEMLLAVSKPIFKYKTLNGVVGAYIKLDQLNELVSNTKLGENGVTYIVDANGRIIAHPDKTLAAKRYDINQEFDYDKLKNSEDKSIEYSFDGEEYLVSYEELPEIGGAVITETPIRETYQSSFKIRNIIIIGGFLILLFSVLAIYFSIRYMISRPINQSLQFANSIAAGKLNIDDLKYKSNDEIGKLNKALNLMKENLQYMIGQVVGLSESVAASSEELSASGEQVGEIAEQVGASIQRVSAGAGEQSTLIDESLKNVKLLMSNIQVVGNRNSDMADSANSVMKSINNGKNSVSNSMTVINEVEKDTVKVAGVIHELGSSSEEIGNIIEIIDGIAEQTNLLALNAAIEAARAGEAGRGFSVVADEIRDLAAESAEATKRIADIIKQIQNSVSDATQKMHNSRETVKQGVSAIENAGEVFKEIEKLANTLEDIIQEVNDSTKLMINSGKEVEKATNNIASVSEEFAGSSEEVAASSEEQIASTEEIISSSRKLSEIADELLQAVRKFKV